MKSYAVCSLFRLAKRFIQSVECVNHSSFSSLMSRIPLYDYTTVYLPMHPLKDIWIVSGF